MIVLNCVTLGIEAEMSMGRATELGGVVAVLEHVFSVAFLIELVMRVSVYGLRVLRRCQYLTDLAVVTATCIAVWLLPMCGQDNRVFIRPLTVLRMSRIPRLIGALRHVDVLREVFLLLRGLRQSMRVLAGTIMVIFFITYVFAIFGVMLIGSEIVLEHEKVLEGDDGLTIEEQEELEHLVAVVGDIMSVMYLLVQVLTLDSWTSMARPIQKYVPWAWVYFYLYIAVNVVVLMNLVTAIIVEGALKNSKLDEQHVLAEKEKKKEAALQQVVALFDMMDQDGDGCLSWKEFKQAFEHEDICNRLKLLNCDPAKAREIFDLLDTGDGALSVDEFFEGVIRLEGVASSRDVFRVTKVAELLVKMLSQHSEEVHEDLDELLRNTPGATISTRTGTLTRRAKKRCHGNIHFDTASTIKGVSSQTFSPRRASDAGGPGGGGLGGGLAGAAADLARQVDQIAKTVEASRSEAQARGEACNKKLDVCGERIANLSLSLADIKSCLALMRQQGQGGGGSGLRHGGGGSIGESGSLSVACASAAAQAPKRYPAAVSKATVAAVGCNEHTVWPPGAAAVALAPKEPALLPPLPMTPPQAP